jgi:O-antigen/teichoic acid export membrane protein
MIIDPKDQKKPPLYYFFKIEGFKRFSEIFASVFGLVSAFFILRGISVYEFGLYQLVLSLISIALSFNVMEVFDGIVALDMRRYFNSGDRNKSKRIFLENAIPKIGLGLIITLAVFGGADLIARYYDRDIGLFIKIASLLIISNVLLTVERTFLKAVFSFTHWGFAFFKEFLRMIFIIALVVGYRLDLTGVIIAHAAADLAVLAGVTMFSFFRLYRRAFAGVAAYSQSLMMEIVKSYGFLSVLRFIASKTTSNAIPWFIKFIVNTEGVALYTLARGVLDTMGGLMPLTGSAELLALKIHDREAMTRIFRRTLKYAFWLGVILSVFGLTVLPPILVWLFPNYAPAMPLVRIMLLVLPVFGVYKVVKSMITVLRELEVMIKKALNEVWVVLIGTPILLGFFGLYGSALIILAMYTERILYFYPKLVEKHPYLKIHFWDLISFNASDRQFLQGVFRYGWAMIRSLLGFKKK